MSFVKVHTQDGIATVVLGRGKVNALNVAVVAELHERFMAMEADEAPGPWC
jgi:enoyl-CoA hydratase/carnithine racemase